MNIVDSVLRLLRPGRNSVNFYHIHKIRNNDNQWQVGNEISISNINDFTKFSYTELLWQTKKPFDEYQIFLRELSLEYIRIKEFSDYPSRKQCIWLIRPEENQLIYWIKELGLIASEYQIFEVVINDNSMKIFKGRCGLLPKVWDNYCNMLESAKEYWSYKNNKDLCDDEYLYEGKLKIISEIPLSFFGLTSQRG